MFNFKNRKRNITYTKFILLLLNMVICPQKEKKMSFSPYNTSVGQIRIKNLRIKHPRILALIYAGAHLIQHVAPGDS